MKSQPSPGPSAPALLTPVTAGASASPVPPNPFLARVHAELRRVCPSVIFDSVAVTAKIGEDTSWSSRARTVQNPPRNGEGEPFSAAEWWRGPTSGHPERGQMSGSANVVHSGAAPRAGASIYRSAPSSTVGPSTSRWLVPLPVPGRNFPQAAPVSLASSRGSIPSALNAAAQRSSVGVLNSIAGSALAVNQP